MNALTPGNGEDLIPDIHFDTTVYTPSLEHENFLLTIKKLGQVTLSAGYYKVVEFSTGDEYDRYVASRSSTSYYQDVYVEAVCSCGNPRHVEWWFNYQNHRIREFAEIVAHLESWDADRRTKIYANTLPWR